MSLVWHQFLHHAAIPEMTAELRALCSLLAHELRLRYSQVEATVPFLARYRKEQSGGLDEVAIEAIRVGIERLRECEKRRAAIVASFPLGVPSACSAIL